MLGSPKSLELFKRILERGAQGRTPTIVVGACPVVGSQLVKPSQRRRRRIRPHVLLTVEHIKVPCALVMATNAVCYLAGDPSLWIVVVEDPLELRI